MMSFTLSFKWTLFGMHILILINGVISTLPVHPSELSAPLHTLGKLSNLTSC